MSSSHSAQTNTRPTGPVRLSVVITNYNYEQFVGAAIDSVLGQDVPIELIVVDDCSTDGSREVIAAYGDQLVPIFLNPNEGHAGGCNAGFTRTTGELVMFLDSDDFLLPGAALKILENYDPDAVLYMYRMRYADDTGALSGLFPSERTEMANGDISQLVREVGRYNGTVTSGLVYARGVLDKLLPIDPVAFRTGAEGYMVAAAPLYGKVRSSNDVISGYRQHANQHSKFARAYAKRARWCLAHDAARYDAIRSHAAKLGLPVASDLGERDPENIHERLVSLLFEPELHPVEGDSVARLIDRAAVLNAKGASGLKKLFGRLYWGTFRAIPMGFKRQLMTWRVDEKSRPAWLKVIGKFIFRRLKIGSL